MWRWAGVQEGAERVSFVSADQYSTSLRAAGKAR
jgi:hypothetical protein